MLASRALSSADEGGPALKKLRSTTRGVEKAPKSVAAADDARSKKARARPALTLVNLFPPIPSKVGGLISWSRAETLLLMRALCFSRHRSETDVALAHEHGRSR